MSGTSVVRQLPGAVTAGNARVWKGAALVLLAVGTTVWGLVGYAAPANAASDYVIFLAAGEANQTPPVQTVGGLAIGLVADRDQAYQIALSNCAKHGGHQCVVVVDATNACAAVATNDFGQTVGASDVALQNAQSSATRMLDSKQGAHIVESGCANGFVPTPTPAPPAAPPPPAAGPTIDFNPIIGGLRAHVTDRSGTSSQCTYVTDHVNRSFALPANGSHDVDLVPAVPQLRNWTVTVSCDNGAKTQTSTFF